jgi:uncharacterized UBP type Zn finger protein
MLRLPVALAYYDVTTCATTTSASAATTCAIVAIARHAITRCPLQVTSNAKARAQDHSAIAHAIAHTTAHVIAHAIAQDHTRPIGIQKCPTLDAALEIWRCHSCLYLCFKHSVMMSL